MNEETTVIEKPAPESLPDERAGWTSASNAAADLLCQARHLRQKKLPPEIRRSSYAETGDRIHKALATRLPDGLEGPEKDTYDACLDQEGKILANFFGADNVPKLKVWVEQRFWATIKKVEDGVERVFQHSAKPDKVFRHEDAALIIEYKTLFGDVPGSPSNFQLRDQMVCVRGNIPLLKRIGVVVIQPNVTRDPQIAVYDSRHFQAAEREMFDRVYLSNDPDAEANPGEVQCQHCAAKVACKEYHTWAGGMLPAMNVVLEVPMDMWTAEQWTRAARALKPAQDLLDLVKENLKAGLAKNPNFCSGWRLRPGPIRETISDPGECANRFMKMGGKPEQFLKAVSITKSKLKEILAELTGAKGETLAAAMDTITRGIVEEKQSAPSLVEADE